MAARTLRLGLLARAAPTGDGASPRPLRPRPLRARTRLRAWVRTVTVALTLTLNLTLTLTRCNYFEEDSRTFSSEGCVSKSVIEANSCASNANPHPKL